MKKTILSIVFLAFSLASFSQSTPPAHTSDYYLAKSKRQRNTAWIMLGGGVALIGLGVVITAAPTMSTDHGNTAADVMGLVGFTSSLGSIPMFISASKNKRKAAALSFNLQKFPHAAPAAAYQAAALQPALKLSIGL